MSKSLMYKSMPVGQAGSVSALHLVRTMATKVSLLALLLMLVSILGKL